MRRARRSFGCSMPCTTATVPATMRPGSTSRRCSGRHGATRASSSAAGAANFEPNSCRSPARSSPANTGAPAASPTPTSILQLKRHGIQRLIVIGLIAHTCIEATVRFAAELGYDVTVIKDAVADYSDEMMHAALELNMPNYASAIVTTGEDRRGAVVRRIPWHPPRNDAATPPSGGRRPAPGRVGNRRRLDHATTRFSLDVYGAGAMARVVEGGAGASRSSAI